MRPGARVHVPRYIHCDRPGPEAAAAPCVGMTNRNPKATEPPIVKHPIQSLNPPATLRTYPPTAGAAAKAVVNALAPGRV